MFDRKSPLALLAIAVTLTAAAVTSQTRPLVIARVNVVDVVNGTIAPNRTVTISDRLITSVTPDAAPPAGSEVVNGDGKFLIPGLWDMHAHMQMVGEPWLQLYVANGVTGIRDMGSDVEFILNLRDATSSGRVLGPRI